MRGPAAASSICAIIALAFSAVESRHVVGKDEVLRRTAELGPLPCSLQPGKWTGNVDRKYGFALNEIVLSPRDAHAGAALDRINRLASLAGII